MIDLGISELDAAILDGVDRVLSRASSPGWRVDAEGRCTLDRSLWAHLADLIVADPDEPIEGLTFASALLVSERLGYSLVGVPLIDQLVALRLADAIGGDVFSRMRADLRAGGEAVGLLLAAEQSRAAQPAICMNGAIARWIIRIGDNSIAVLRQEDAEMGKLAPNLADLPASVIKAESNRWVNVAGANVASACAISRAERKVLVSAVVYGLCEQAIALAVAYANERQLFGGPIGGFQSLAHSLASAKVQADGVQLLAREAAWARDADIGAFDRLARMAYAFAAMAGDQATRAAVHIFGGYGVTREYPVQNYFRMARALCLLVGDRRLELQTIGQSLLAG